MFSRWLCLILAATTLNVGAEERPAKTGPDYVEWQAEDVHFGPEESTLEITDLEKTRTALPDLQKNNRYIPFCYINIPETPFKKKIKKGEKFKLDFISLYDYGHHPIALHEFKEMFSNLDIPATIKSRHELNDYLAQSDESRIPTFSITLALQSERGIKFEGICTGLTGTPTSEKILKILEVSGKLVPISNLF